MFARLFVGFLATGISLLLVSLVVVALNKDGSDPGLATFWLAVLVFEMFAAYRNLSAVVVADSRGLLVRNPLGTKRLSWRDVEDFRTGGAVTLITSAVVVVLRNGGVLTLHATERSWSAERFDRMLSDLRAWLPGSA